MHNFRNRIALLALLIFLFCPFRQASYSLRNSLLSPLNESFNRLVFNKLIEDQNAEVIDVYMEKFRIQNGLKGVAVAVVKDEKLVFAKG